MCVCTIICVCVYLIRILWARKFAWRHRTHDPDSPHVLVCTRFYLFRIVNAFWSLAEIIVRKIILIFQRKINTIQHFREFFFILWKYNIIMVPILNDVYYWTVIVLCIQNKRFYCGYYYAHDRKISSYFFVSTRV